MSDIIRTPEELAALERKHIVISASWKHTLAVKLLVEFLNQHCADLSITDFTVDQGGESNDSSWFTSPEGRARQAARIEAASHADLLIYVGPSGADAWCEVGAAMAHGVPVIGWDAKGEGVGLHRAGICWTRELFGILGYARDFLFSNN